MTSGAPSPPPGLPRTRGARIGIALLALPTALILTTFAISLPIMAGPIRSPWDLLGVVLLAEFLGFGALWAWAALLWAVATPRWVERLLLVRGRALVLLGGLFLVVCGSILSIVNAAYGQPIPAVIMGAGVIMGVEILRRARVPRSPEDEDRS